MGSVCRWVEQDGIWDLICSGHSALLARLGPGPCIGFVVRGFLGHADRLRIGNSLGRCAFLIARYLARDWVYSKARTHRRFSAVDRAIVRESWKIVGLLRLSPVIPFSVSNYLYGLTSVPFWSYLLATWIGTMPGTLMYV